ncbi:hypothetical protein BT93_D0026 [Corymbia citriodora subsp. variegata]|nr:hypothetical protein BT93_D0026 [Corymbia citriodora subsp. variegata]
MSSIPAPTPAHPVSASSSSSIVPPTHSSHVSPPPVPSNTFPISSSALPPPSPHPSLSTRPRSSWIESLRSQARSNLFREAISTYGDMMALAGIPPDQFAFPAVLKAAAGLQDLNLGRQIHAHAVKLGYEQSSVTVANTLLTMYDKCGDIGNVFKLFDRIPERDQVSWNSMLAALCRDEEWVLALDCFRSMVSENLEPSSFTLVSLALACSNLPQVDDGLKLGKQVHAYSLRKGDRKTFTNNSLMTMYSKLGRVGKSRALFESFEDRDLISWNTIISSFAQNECFLEALMLLVRMVRDGIRPDGVTIASVLPTCAQLQMLSAGRELHAYALRNEALIGNSFVGSALVDMYCNCGRIESGHRVFDSLSDRQIGVWNAMIAGYAQNEQDHEALMLFLEMEAIWGLCSNATTIASILPACARCKAFSFKESIHGHVIKKGLQSDMYVQNALMDMYARMGKIGISRIIFDSMEVRDLVSWNTMITASVISECHESALALLMEMQSRRKDASKDEDMYNDERVHSWKPNSVTLMTVLPGCASLAAILKGKEIHGYAIRNSLALDVAVGSALVDMYAKCGCLYLSRRMFDQMPVRNIVTWNVIIMAYGMHGKGEEALQLFKNMVGDGAGGEGVMPNEVTFIALFAACSHSGMVEEGMRLFYSMKDEHGVEPLPDHYACVVDLLGRAGQVAEAFQLIDSMPSEYDKTGAWSSLLGACRIHQNLEVGEIAAMNLLELEPDVASHYVLLSNIYSSAGLWDKAMDVRRKMKERGVRKEPGCSWTEFGDEVHKFIAGESSHPQSQELHRFLETLSDRMRKEGYVPDTSCVLHNVNEEEKEALLCGHSEKLAIAFGILNTPPGMTIRVAKNLRVCNDCHTATKFISKIEEREIILRDVRRFHHFRDGKCSCGDYW